MNELERTIKKLKNLPQYKNMAEEELNKIAQENLERSEILSSLTFCINEEEIKFAKNLLENYLAQSSFENFSEKQTLGQLIDQELLSKRMKDSLKTQYSAANPSIPLQMIEQLDAVIERIEGLKVKLGLSQKEKTNALNEWAKLKAKALAYYKENQGCNVVKCPYCQKLFMLLKDIKNYTSEKLPWFRKTLLYNHKLFQLYEQNRITKEEMCIIFGVSSDYIDLIFENEYKNKK